MVARAAGLILLSAASIIAAPISSNITWIDCLTAIPPVLAQNNINVTSTPAKLKCGTINVPLDHSADYSANNTLQLGFAVYNLDDAKRLVTWNPGGPSAPAVSTAWAIPLRPDLPLGHFGPDVAFLAVDPRGSGYSTAFNCTAGDTVPLYNKLQLLGLPPNRTDFDQFQAEVKTFAASCQPQALLAHMASEDLVKDFELVRQALGYQKTNYVGVSYGAQLGQVYTKLYPESLESVIIDGVFSAAIAPSDQIYYYTLSDNRLIERTDAFCMVDVNCPFHSQGKGGVINALAEVLSRAANGTLNNLTVTDVQAGIVTGFFQGQQDYPAIALALSSALNNDTSALDIATQPVDPSAASLLLWPTFCADHQFPTDAEGYYGLIYNETSTAADKYNLNLTALYFDFAVCSAWPVRRSSPSTFVDFTIPVLVVNSDFDPETPAEWAITVYNNSANATLLIRHGDNHGTITDPSNATLVELDYVTNRTAPAVIANELLTVWSHTNSTNGSPVVADPYATVLGVAAGDISNIYTINFTAINSTSPPVYVDNGGGDNGGSGNGAIGITAGSSLLASSLVVALWVSL